MISIRETIKHESQWPRVDAALAAAKKMPFPKSGVEVIVRHARRTNRQNRYLWGVVYNTLAQGMTEQGGALVKPEWVHELCKQYFMPHIPVPGTDKTVPLSTTELCRSGNESAFQDYVEQIQALGAAKGIYIPDPHETYPEE